MQDSFVHSVLVARTVPLFQESCRLSYENKVHTRCFPVTRQSTDKQFQKQLKAGALYRNLSRMQHILQYPISKLNFRARTTNAKNYIN